MRHVRFSPSVAILVILGSSCAIYAWSDHPFYGGEPGFGRTQQAIGFGGVALVLLAAARSRIRRPAAAFALATICCLGVTELLLEILYSCRLRHPYVHDQELLFRLREGSCAEFRHLPVNGGSVVRYRINADGFRGPELRLGAGSIRVVVYGDSFIQAAFSAEPDTFVRQLEQHWNRDRLGAVEVINAGVASYGPDQIALKMARDLPVLKPDLVIVSVFAGNDFGDIERNKLYRLDDAHGLQRDHRAHMTPELLNRFNLSGKESLLKVLFRQAVGGYSEVIPAAVLGASDPGAALVEHWLELALAEHASYSNSEDYIISNVNVDFYNADVALLPRSASAHGRKQLMAAVLREIHGVASRHQVALLGIIVPHPMDVCDGYDTGRVDIAKYPEYRRTNLTDAVASAWAAAGVDAIDLFPILQGDRCRDYFLAGGDDHWSDAGQVVAARFVADMVVQKGLLTGKLR